MMQRAIFLILAASLPVSASALCRKDSLAEKSEDSSVLRMLSGLIFKIDSYDTFDTRLWLTTDNVVVCFDGTTYDLVRGDNLVRARRVR